MSANVRDETAEDSMTTTPSDASSNIPGKPPIVDRATWQAARDELLVREKAHTREGDAIAAARRRLPMVEIDGTAEVTGANGPVPFLDLFQGRASSSCTTPCGTTARRPRGSARVAPSTSGTCATPFTSTRGASRSPVLTSARWDEVARYVEFMGY